MLSWILRISAFAATMFFSYYLFDSNLKAVAMGAGVALIVILLEAFLKYISLTVALGAVVGAFAGTALHWLVDFIISNIQNQTLLGIWNQYSKFVLPVFVIVGAILTVEKAVEEELSYYGKLKAAKIRFVDVSALIDGRIADLCVGNFLTGGVFVPKFVLDKLGQMTADRDPFVRAQGKRGLESFRTIEKSGKVFVKLISKDPAEIKDIGGKIIKLAKHANAQILTADYNLHKTAIINDVPIVNIPDIAFALKQPAVPGETLSVFIMKEGREKQQGVGYLDDGAMVVVDDGKKWIGKKLDVVVCSVLQTSTGKMIFARAKNETKQNA